MRELRCGSDLKEAVTIVNTWVIGFKIDDRSGSNRPGNSATGAGRRLKAMASTRRRIFSTMAAAKPRDSS